MGHDQLVVLRVVLDLWTTGKGRSTKAVKAIGHISIIYNVVIQLWQYNGSPSFSIFVWFCVMFLYCVMLPGNCTGFYGVA